MKRFSIVKVKQHSYSRQGWKLKDLGYMFTVYDREWRKNLEKGHGFTTRLDVEYSYKYIDSTSKKEVAQYWVDWLNANCTEEFGHKIRLPISVFNEGLKL